MKRPAVHRPLIFAHRGASQAAPENTLPAFEAALEMGADGIELDTQYTSDAQLVVLHNLTLDATTNGSGPVAALTLTQLRRLDAGSWFSTRFAGARIPTLEEVLYWANGRCLLNIELKSADLVTASLGKEVASLVRAHDMANQVIISSFNPFALRAARKAAPEIEGALLLAPDLPRWMHSRLARRFSLANGLHPEAPMVDSAYMAYARRLGLSVRPWTVDRPAEMQRLAALGVDALITNVPDLALAVL